MSLVDAIREQLRGDALRPLAAELGRGEEQARSAVDAALPALLAALSNQLLDGAALDALLGSLRERPAGSAAAEPSDVLEPVLGTSFPALVGLLSVRTGLAEPAVRRLLRTLGPIVLDAVAARSRAEGGLDAEHLIHVFSADKPKIAEALPEGLTLADLPSIPGVPTVAPPPASGAAGAPGWVLPALAAALVAASVWIFLKQPLDANEAPGLEMPVQPPAVDTTPPPPPIEREAARPESAAAPDRGSSEVDGDGSC